jgi:uncharacterized membrane protein YbaN (DUF454 family)
VQETSLIEIGATAPGGDSGSKQPSLTPKIAIDERAGTVRVCDPRVFRAGHRAFCRRLLEAATRRPTVRQVEVDLDSASCRLEFGPGSVSAEDIAGTFAAAVRDAAEKAPDTKRTPLWRIPPDWCVLTVYRLPGKAESSLWETLERKPGRIRVRNRGRAGDHGRLARLAEVLPGLEGIESCCLARWSGELTIEFRPASPIAVRLLDEVERTLEELRVSPPLEPTPAGSAPGRAASRVDTGLKRLEDFALAGASLALTLVGLVVPGIPTVPFLLATSYYLARSSPWLDEKLRRTAFFGPILVEWEEYGGLSWKSKDKLIGLAGLILVVTLILTPLSPLTVLVVVLLWFLSLYCTTRLPGLSQEQEGRLRPGGAASQAVPGV